MPKIDYSKVESAISDYNSDFKDALLDYAEETYVFSSIIAINTALKKGVITPEVYNLNKERLTKVDSKGKYPQLDAEDIDDLEPSIRKNAYDDFVSDYSDELDSGGRTVKVGNWSEPGDEGARTYRGFDEKFVPWLSQMVQGQKEEIYNTLNSGKSAAEIKADLDSVFQNRDTYNDLVARTEVLNNSEHIQNTKLKKEGFDKFLWVCSLDPGSPCEEYCASFCGQIYTAETLPMGGDLVHPRCKCSKHPIISDVLPESWKDLPVAESSLYARDLRGEKRVEKAAYESDKLKFDEEAYKQRQYKVLSNEELKRGEKLPVMPEPMGKPLKDLKPIKLPEGYNKYDSTNLDLLAGDIKSIAKTNPEFDSALKQYTSGPYKKINKLAREEWTPASKSTEAKYQKIIDNLSTGLKEAPNYTGTVHRGIGFSTQEKFNEMISDGGLRTFKGFTSTSTDVNVARNFVNMGDKPYRVSMEIQSKTGTYLDGASYYRKNQEEVLFNTKTNFRVKSVNRLSDNTAHLILEEV